MTAMPVATDRELFLYGLAVAPYRLERLGESTVDGRSVLNGLATELHAVLKNEARTDLRIEFAPQTFRVDEVDQTGPSLQAGHVLRNAQRRGLRAATFGGLVDGPAIAEFLQVLLSGGRLTHDEHRAIRRSGALTGIGLQLADDCDQSSPEQLHDGSLQDLTTTLHDQHIAAARGHALPLDDTVSTVDRTLTLLDENPAALLSLAQEQDVDQFTVGHSARVAVLAMMVAKGLGMSREEQHLVGTCGLLHDIGKARIPDDVLFKRDRLDARDWEWMSDHPRLGAEILLRDPDVPAEAVGVAFGHHLRPNGTGYPRTSIPVRPSSLTLLIRVCDVYEALTARRPYKPALSSIDALTLMHRDPEDHDPRWLRAFVDRLGLYPPGTELNLPDGRRGLVVERGPQIWEPVVQLIGGSDAGSRRTVDLSR